MVMIFYVLFCLLFNDGCLGSCLYLFNFGDGLLFCGDVVYVLLVGSYVCQVLELMLVEIELFVLLEDFQVCGIEDVFVCLVVVDYFGFVEFVICFDKVNSWL